MEDKELCDSFQNFLNTISKDKSVILPQKINEVLPAEESYDNQNKGTNK